MYQRTVEDSTTYKIRRLKAFLVGWPPEQTVHVMVDASPRLGIVSAFCDESFYVLHDAVAEVLFGLLIGAGITSRVLWLKCCRQGEEFPTDTGAKALSGLRCPLLSAYRCPCRVQQEAVLVFGCLVCVLLSPVK